MTKSYTTTLTDAQWQDVKTSFHRMTEKENMICELYGMLSYIERKKAVSGVCFPKIFRNGNRCIIILQRGISGRHRRYYASP